MRWLAAARLQLDVHIQVHQYVPHYLEQRTRPVTDSYADFAPATPLVPFGYGLSYTTFTYSKAQLLNSQGQPCDERQKGCSITGSGSNSSATFSVSVDVTNAGSRDGKTVVQVYFAQRLASRVRFSQMLLDFQKVEIAAGKTQTVVVEIPVTGLEMWSNVEQK